MDKPTTGQIATTAGVTLARGLMKWFCAFLTFHGVMMSASTTETVTGIGVGLLVEGWSLWNSYGKDILTAGLDILRSKVVNAAASARVGAVSPQSALARLDAHVAETAPAKASIAVP